jgi:hypothetical protein
MEGEVVDIGVRLLAPDNPLIAYVSAKASTNYFDYLHDTHISGERVENAECVLGFR